ncbi:MAG: hypothetical protein HKN42_03585 [Granulosicoccus sp.]|nr:hypothetical protein [Granulosicoccus sp.]
MAIIGDVPYQGEDFPSLISSINADPFVKTVVHVGDIKSGESECLDQHYWDIRWSFLTFEEPLVYTFGDNEWADCDRDSAGAYDPQERLAKLRDIFFDVPGSTLGGRDMQVESQPGYPENQLWQDKDILFATVHIVGSNNNLKNQDVSPPSEQTATLSSEYGKRTAANIAWLRGIFSRAFDSDSAGVALFFHADMWKLKDHFDRENFSGYTEIVQELSRLTEAYARPVVFVSGENHHFRMDPGVPWFAHYGANPANNVTQLIVEQGVSLIADGADQRNTWLRLIADATTENVFSWEQVVGR